MFSKAESSRIRQEFWTTFGQYMKPVLSSEGIRINWINYNTGLKDVYFRMETLQKSAEIAIFIAHKDLEIQELFFMQFEELKTLLHSELGEEWNWELYTLSSDGKVTSRIYQTLHNVSVFNQDHWSDLISFFKPRIIALDRFWENAQYAFESLR